MRRRDIVLEMRPGGCLRPTIRAQAEAGGAYVIAAGRDNHAETALATVQAAMLEGLGDEADLPTDLYDASRLARWPFLAWAKVDPEVRAPLLADVLPLWREDAQGHADWLPVMRDLIDAHADEAFLDRLTLGGLLPEAADDGGVSQELPSTRGEGGLGIGECPTLGGLPLSPPGAEPSPTGSYFSNARPHGPRKFHPAVVGRNLPFPSRSA